MGANPSFARRRLEGTLALAGAQLCFGLFPLFQHFATDRANGFTPRALVFWRVLFGALVLAAIAALRHGRAFLVAPRELPRLFLAGLLGVPLNMALAMEGMSRTSVLFAGLLVTQIPVFTYAFALLFGQERAVARRTLGIGVALCGALVLVLARAEGSSPLGSSRAGVVLMVANCLSYAVYLVLARELLRRRAALVVSAWIFLLSLPTLPLLALGQDLVPDALDGRAALGFAYSLVFPTVVAFFLNAFALERVSASTVAVFINLQPLVAGAAGALVLGELPTPVAWVAAGLLAAGIWLVAAGRSAAEEHGSEARSLQGGPPPLRPRRSFGFPRRPSE